MGIIRHNQFLTTLLILASVVYTLVAFGDTVYASETEDTKNPVSITATAQADKREIIIGDKIHLRIQVKYAGDLTVQFPERDQHLGVFTTKAAGVVEEPKRDKEGYVTVGRNYVISSYEIGQQTIPSVKIKYTGKHGEGEVATHEIAIDVKGVLKEGEISGDIKDILPPVDVPTNFKRLVPWISAGLAALLVPGIIYWLVRKYKTDRKRLEREFVKRTPHEVAYELLERLVAEDLITKGFIKEYYYRIANIIRHYIEDRFGLLAPERTTEEFFTEMAHTDKLEDPHKLLIREFLEQCDRVKYAKYGPSNLEIQETYAAAKRLIDETRERVEEKEVIAG